jgi:hypothetical protein
MVRLADYFTTWATDTIQGALGSFGAALLEPVRIPLDRGADY